MLDQITVIKRDGREVPFDRCRISDAILKAAKDFEEFSPTDVIELTDRICNKLYHRGHPSFAVEEIQDEVVDTLTSTFPKIATAYQLYRQKRTDAREIKSVENKLISEVAFVDSRDNDDARENANINADTMAGGILKIGAGVAKEFYLRNLVKPEHAQMHREGKIHIHDSDLSFLAFNCCSIPLGKLLMRGFANGHGALRPPATIGSAATLMCIIIQANQNNMFGGQAIPMMDYDLAPYVAKSYVRNVALYLEMHGYADYNFLKKHFVKPLDEYIHKHDHVIDEAGCVAIKSTLYQIFPHLDLLNEESELFDFVLKKTERDVYQSMEATVHNLCSLACLHPLQEFWVYDRLMKQWCIYTAQEFHRAYEPHRFCALSFNKDTGEVEAQEITGVTEHDNTKPVYYIQDKTGTGMMVTNDHRCLTITDDGQYKYVPAEDLEYTVYPRTFKIPTTVDWEHEEYDVSVNSPRRRQANSPYPHDTVKYSTALAELMGYYVGDGAMASGDSGLQFCVDVKVPEEKFVELFQEALGITPKTHVYYRPRLNDPTVKAPMTVLVYVGVHVSRMFERLCGRGAENKHVPDFILHGSHEIQNAFLKGYLTCDGCRTKKYIEFSTVSRFLIFDLKLLFLSRGELLISSCKYETDGTGVGYGMNNRRPLYTGRIGTLAAKRLGLADSGVFAFREDITFEIPRYDSQHLVKYIKDAGVPWGPLPRLPRSNPHKKGEASTTTTRYHIVEKVELPEDKHEHMQRLLKSYRVPVKKKVNYGPISVVYDIEVANNHNFMLASGAIVHNSRAGSQVPFSSVNFGTDTSEEGRMVSRNLMLALDAGLGAGETAIFPISIFKLKKGINRAEGEPNYDLFKLACKVSAKRLFPNFVNIDAPFNLQYYKPGHPETQVSSMGAVAKGTVSITYGNDVYTGDISQFDAWLISRGYISDSDFIQFDQYTDYVNLPQGFFITDPTGVNGCAQIKKYMRYADPHLDWYKTTFQHFGVITTIYLTEDHPLPVAYLDGTVTGDQEVVCEIEGMKFHRTPLNKIDQSKKVFGLMNIDGELIAAQLSFEIDPMYHAVGYDFETSTDRFVIKNIVSNNCRTRVIGNYYDPTRQIVPGRGNLFVVTINLPWLALETKESLKEGEDLYEKFMQDVDKTIDACVDQLNDRFEMICKRTGKNFPFLVGQGVYLDSEKIGPNDSIREMIMHGTRTVGFIGLAETLQVLFGEHHGESEFAQEKGLEIISHMNTRITELAKKTNINYSFMGSPAEGCTGRLCRLLRKRFGVIPGITDKEFLTNSHHRV